MRRVLKVHQVVNPTRSRAERKRRIRNRRGWLGRSGWRRRLRRERRGGRQGCLRRRDEEGWRRREEARRRKDSHTGKHSRDKERREWASGREQSDWKRRNAGDTLNGRGDNQRCRRGEGLLSGLRRGRRALRGCSPEENTRAVERYRNHDDRTENDTQVALSLFNRFSSGVTHALPSPSRNPVRHNYTIA